MDPKQTVPQGGSPGGQEGQNGQPQSSTGANPVATPIFSSTGASNPTAGKLGSDTLSTGANVSRTIDSLNSKNQSETSQSIFKRKKFEKVVPVSGDLLIDPTFNPERKAEQLEHSKTVKLVGISIAVVAVLLLGGIIFALIAGGGKEKPKNTNTPVAVSADAAFNEYANYILYGEESQEPIAEEVSIANQYTVDNMIYADVEDKNAYFAEAKTYFDGFIDVYGISGLDEKSYFLNWYVPYYQQVFNFVYNAVWAGKLDVATLLPVYLESGADGIEAYFNENYGVFGASDFPDAQDYYNYQRGVADYMKKYFDTASRWRCIKNDELVAGCNVPMSDEDMLLYSDSYDRATKKVELLVNSIILGIGQISVEMKNPTNEDPMDGSSDTEYHDESNDNADEQPQQSDSNQESNNE